MIHFKTINEVLNYRNNCPLCHKGIVSVTSPDVKSYQTLDGFKDTLVWDNPQEEITINLNDDSVEKMTLKSGAVQNFGYNTTVTYVSQSSSSINNGIMYLKLTLECEECQRYSYMAQILIDTKTFKVFKIVMNSEALFLEDDKGSHEITNVYTMGKTEYCHFPLPNYDSGPLLNNKGITLPLIDLDLEHPEKTLERIKTLIVFS
jgi:hypothetical protein